MDITNVIKDLSNAAENGLLDTDMISRYGKMGKQYSSISKRASEGTLQFPVLVSSALDIETAQNICKALERNYSTFAQIAFSHTPIDTWNKKWTSTDYLRKFHQNTGIKTDKHDVMSALNNLIDSYTEIDNGNIITYGAVYETSTGRITASNKEQLFDVLEHVRHDILNNKYIPKAEVIYNFNDKDLNAKYNRIVTEAGNDQHNKRMRAETKRHNRTTEHQQKKQNEEVARHNREVEAETRRHNEAEEQHKRDQFAHQQAVDNEKLSIDHADLVYRIQNDKFNQDFKEKEFGYRQKRDEIDDKFRKKQFEYTKKRDKLQSRSIELNKDMLQDNDVKKSNELVATILHVRVRLVNKKDEDMGIVDFNVGIKCIMHPIKSNDMVNNLVNGCRNNDKIFRFLRWTTGEVSFLKDLVFNLREIQTDVANYKMGSSRWWLSLKRRKSLSKLKDSFLLGIGGLLPNATIVTTAEEVEYIKTQYGFDLFNPIFFNKIIDEYFLLGFVIVDNSAEIAHFLFEDQTDFQTLTFSALEKASANDERKFKEMLKIVNRA